jgi:MFS family permease
VLGGVLTDANLFGWSWRSVFFVNVPVALISLVATAFLVPETRERTAGRPDLVGAALLAGALVAVVYPLLEGRQLGWPTWVWLLLTCGVAMLALLGFVEKRRQRPQIAPLLRPQPFRIPAFTSGLVVQLLFSAGLQGFFLVFALWLQTGQHYSPLAAGLTTAAFSVGSFILAPVAVPLAQRYGRFVLATGAAMLGLGAVGAGLGASHVGAGTNPWPIVPGLVVAGAGLALLVIPLVNVVLAAVPAAAAGGASGLFSTAQQLGGAIGVAALGTIFFDYLNSHSFLAAFVHTAPFAAAAFLASGVFSLVLPRTAVADVDAEPTSAQEEAA